MSSARVEAFSDGVVAIIITIMVLEMRAPHGASLADLRPVAPAFLSYVLSFVYLGIYWNNHHHLMHVVRHVDGRVMWANLHLLFWLSLVPFVTAWMGENRFAPAPVALYGGVLLMAAVAYWLLVRALLARHGPDSLLARAIGSGAKENVSLLAYGVAILVAYSERWVACAIYVVVAVVWLVPDRRIERVLAEAGGERS
jgi:uncharacterized membrane protein